MRARGLAVIAAWLAVTTPSVAEQAADCGRDVEAAFAAQRASKGWRSLVTSRTAAGQQEQTFEYIPPASMYRKVIVPGQAQPMETIGVGRHAWSDEGGGWHEMQPQFALVIEDHMRDMFNPKPSTTAAYICLGNVSYGGQTYLGYRTVPDSDNGVSGLVRTIYVDRVTGLPAYNLISKIGEEADPDVKQSYTYPDDLKIVPPAGAPMAGAN